MASISISHYSKDDMIPGVRLAGEALSGGDAVKIHTDGTVKKAQADAIANAAIGFVKDDVASGARAVVYRRFVRTDHSSQTVGGRVYLSAGTAGAVTQTQPSTATNIIQCVGVALSATETLYDISNAPIAKVQASGSTTVAFA